VRLTATIRLFLLLLSAAAGAACASSGTASSGTAVPATTATGETAPLIQPGAPGAANRTVGAEQAADLSKVQATEADVKFMQGMIGHHAQALEMVELLEKNSQSDDMKRMALRIKISQDDEIGMMKDWLTARGKPLPDAHAHHTHEGMMPGMLTPEQMQKLAAARGKEFDALFLEYMIQHHEGALTMVKELFATPGAAQEGDVFAFASDVDADQAMEISRMGAMLRELRK
jgi:uncharacterized protein (DUF305 family)